MNRKPLNAIYWTTSSDWVPMRTHRWNNEVGAWVAKWVTPLRVGRYWVAVAKPLPHKPYRNKSP